jgi:hypothetical protein
VRAPGNGSSVGAGVPRRHSLLGKIAVPRVCIKKNGDSVLRVDQKVKAAQLGKSFGNLIISSVSGIVILYATEGMVAKGNRLASACPQLGCEAPAPAWNQKGL